MKLKRTDARSTDIAPRENFSLELVAATALRFLSGDELWHSRFQREAVHAAISFLKICAKEIEADKKIVVYHVEQSKEFEDLGWKASDIIPYEKGIKFITGQTRLERAQRDYETYRKNPWTLERPLTASELTAALKKDEEEGFAASLLQLLRDECRSILAKGRHGPKPRKMLQKEKLTVSAAKRQARAAKSRLNPDNYPRA